MTTWMGLVREREYGRALLYLLGSTTLGTIAILLGMTCSASVFMVVPHVSRRRPARA